MKSGFVSIVGRPNVGKSTLINAIVGKKISIVTPKSQTTRESIVGIYNDDESQIVFFDTPGIHKPHNELGEILDKKAYRTIRDCELALLVVDTSKEMGEGDEYIINHLKFDCDLFLVFNKIDLTNILLVNRIKDKYQKAYPNAKSIEISALTLFNVNDLIKMIKDILPEGPRYYDITQITDKDFRFQVQEIIREKALLNLKEEVPHGIAVLCDDIDTSKKELEIFAKIIVERESQKGIVIGQKGKMIKKIGIQSRRDIETLIGKHISLHLMVQVVENWRNSSSFLVKIGYR